MLRKKNKQRYIDKIVNKLNNDEAVEKIRIIGGIAFDMLDELQELDGEAYINSAAKVIECLGYVDFSALKP